MTAETIGIISVAVVQVGLFAKVWLNDKRAANASHVQSIEKIQDRLYGEIKQLQQELADMRKKLDNLYERHQTCVASLSAAQTRLELLEKFRNVAAGDSPTGDTLRAMPPSLIRGSS